MTLGMSDSGYKILSGALRNLTDHDLSLAHDTLEGEKRQRKANARKKVQDLRRDERDAQIAYELLCEKLRLDPDVEE